MYYVLCCPLTACFRPKNWKKDSFASVSWVLGWNLPFFFWYIYFYFFLLNMITMWWSYEAFWPFRFLQLQLTAYSHCLGPSSVNPRESRSAAICKTLQQVVQHQQPHSNSIPSTFCSILLTLSFGKPFLQCLCAQMHQVALLWWTDWPVRSNFTFYFVSEAFEEVESPPPEVNFSAFISQNCLNPPFTVCFSYQWITK